MSKARRSTYAPSHTLTLAISLPPTFGSPSFVLSERRTQGLAVSGDILQYGRLQVDEEPWRGWSAQDIVAECAVHLCLEGQHIAPDWFREHL